jgi:hypothetical protein
MSAQAYRFAYAESRRQRRGTDHPARDCNLRYLYYLHILTNTRWCCRNFRIDSSCRFLS